MIYEDFLSLVSMNLFEPSTLFSEFRRYSNPFSEAVYEEIEYNQMRKKLEMLGRSGLCVPFLTGSRYQRHFFTLTHV